MTRKILTLLLISLFCFTSAHAADVNDYLTPNYHNNMRNFGDPTKGTAYDLGTSWVKSAFDYDSGYAPTPGDKIESITVYKGSDRIKGIKIAYLYADDVNMGAIDGSNYSTETLALDEYIKTIKIYTKKDGRLARLRLWTENGRELYWGSNNGYKYKMANPYTFPNDQVLVGFWGTVEYDKIWSMNLITAGLIELEYVGITWHDDRITSTSEPQLTYSNNIGINDTGLIQSKQLRLGLTQGYSISDSYSNTAGITVGMSVTHGSDLKAGVLTLKESATWSTTASLSTTIGKTEIDNQSFTETHVETLDVDAYTIAAMKGVTTQYTANIPYTITYRNPYDNAIFEIDGTVKDVYYSEGETNWSDIGTIDEASGRLSIDAGWMDIFGHYDGTYAQDYF